MQKNRKRVRRYKNKKNKLKKRLNLIISLIVGLVIFGFFLWKVGLEALMLIYENINFYYLTLYIIMTFTTFLFIAGRWQVILRAYGKKAKKVTFLTLLRQSIAGYAVGYITPSVRLGGEPLRAYMLKKEADIDLRTGSTSIILDKFVELAGTTLFGVLGLILLMYVKGIPFWFKFLLFVLIVFTFLLLATIYYRTVTGKGSFSSLFNLLRLYKISKIENFVKTLEDVEIKLEKFFKNHKKEFMISFFFYFLYGLAVILEMKYLLLSFGISANLTSIILALTLIGLVNFIPVPAALGFLEAGQSSLFYILKGEGSIGFALSIMIRLRNLFFTAVGFALISYFSGNQVRKMVRKDLKKKF
jgi:hypothetical protein